MGHPHLVKESNLCYVYIPKIIHCHHGHSTHSSLLPPCPPRPPCGLLLRTCRLDPAGQQTELQTQSPSPDINIIIIMIIIIMITADHHEGHRHHVHRLPEEHAPHPGHVVGASVTVLLCFYTLSSITINLYTATVRNLH